MGGRGVGVGNRGCVGGEDRGKYDLVGVGRREAKNNPGGGANSDLPAPVGLNARSTNSYELCPSAILLWKSLGFQTFSDLEKSAEIFPHHC